MQEVCLRACSRLDELEGVANPRAWLMRALYHLFIDTARRAPALAVRGAGRRGRWRGAACRATNPAPSEPPTRGACTSASPPFGIGSTPSSVRCCRCMPKGTSSRSSPLIFAINRNALSARLHRARQRLAKLLAAGEPDACAHARGDQTMNCETIDSILDEHRTARLSPAERQEATEHVGGCARCSEAWLADDALRGEAIADPPPELFARCRASGRGARALRALRAAVGLRSPVRPRPLALVAVVATARFALVTRCALEGGPVNAATAALGRGVVAAPAFVAGRDYEVLALGDGAAGDAPRGSR